MGEGALVEAVDLGHLHRLAVEAGEAGGHRLHRHLAGIDDGGEPGVRVQVPPRLGDQRRIEPDAGVPELTLVGPRRRRRLVLGRQDGTPEAVVPGEVGSHDLARREVDLVAADDPGLRGEADHPVEVRIVGRPGAVGVLAATEADHQVLDRDLLEVHREPVGGVLVVDRQVRRRHRDTDLEGAHRPTDRRRREVGLRDDPQARPVAVRCGLRLAGERGRLDDERQVGEHDVVAGDLHVVDRVEFRHALEPPALDGAVEAPPGHERVGRERQRGVVDEPEAALVDVGCRVRCDRDAGFEDARRRLVPLVVATDRGDDGHGLGVDLERSTRVVSNEQPVVDGLHVGVGEVGQPER